MDEVYLGAYRYLPGAGADDGDWRVLQAPVLLGAADVGAWLRQARQGWRDSDGQPWPIRMLGDELDAYPQISAMIGSPGLADVRRGAEIGRAHVCNPVTNSH